MQHFIVILTTECGYIATEVWYNSHRSVVNLTTIVAWGPGTRAHTSTHQDMSMRQARVPSPRAAHCSQYDYTSVAVVPHSRVWIATHCSQDDYKVLH